ncbi:MAG: aminotransferase class IV [Anditalea sp.]
MHGFNTVFLQKLAKEGFTKAESCLANRAAFFGDGVFETMIFSKGKIRFAGEHEERLNLGLNLLKIESSSVTVQELEEFIKQNFSQEKPFRIRWNVYRGGLGKYTPVGHQAVDLIIIQSLDKPDKIKPNAYISKNVSIFPSLWSHCKTLNSLPYVMANIERMEKGMDEVILLSEKGLISEAGAANVFWKKEDVFYTPSLSCNCIAGVGRRKIMEVLKNEGIDMVEGEFLVEDLMAADQVFTSNVTGIAYIACLENQFFDTKPLPLLERLFE